VPNPKQIIPGLLSSISVSLLSIFNRYSWNDQFDLDLIKTHIDNSNLEEINTWIGTDCTGRLVSHGVASDDDDYIMPHLEADHIL
jgi:hypothetical protein